VIEKYQRKLEELSEELEDELAPCREKVNSLRQVIHDTIANMTPELPAVPGPDVNPRVSDWLFDSTRDYFEQLAAYKARKQRRAEQAG